MYVCESGNDGKRPEREEGKSGGFGFDESQEYQEIDDEKDDDLERDVKLGTGFAR